MMRGDDCPLCQDAILDVVEGQGSNFLQCSSSICPFEEAGTEDEFKAFSESCQTESE
jgi:hypothetical protein